jgi:hypothetical protein
LNEIVRISCVIFCVLIIDIFYAFNYFAGLYQLHELKTELELEHENFIGQIKLTETGKPKDLMEMSFETVLILVRTFFLNDLIMAMFL